MDVLSDTTSDAPTSGQRYRVSSVQPNSDGTVSVEAFSETPFPSDGTSTNSGLRDALEHIPNMSYQSASGTAIGSGGPTNVADSLVVWMPEVNQDFGDATHKLEVYAERSGGTDIQIDLYDLETSTTHMSISSISSAGFYNTTTIASAFPTSDARFVLRTTTTGGATGTLTAARWHYDEVTTDLVDPLPPYIAAHQGTTAGISCPSTSGSWARVPSLNTIGLYSESWMAWIRTCLYVDVGTATTLKFALAHEPHDAPPQGSLTDADLVSSTVTVGSTGYHSFGAVPTSGFHHPTLVYQSASGTATFYGYSIMVYQRLVF